MLPKKQTKRGRAQAARLISLCNRGERGGWCRSLRVGSHTLQRLVRCYGHSARRVRIGLQRERATPAANQCK